MTQYDNLGRKVYEYLPYSSAYNGYHSYTYDLANRVTADTLYDASSSPYRTISIAYSGQTVGVTDPNGNTIYKVTDVAGKLRKVIDPSPGGTTSYTYDPFGNLITLVDATGNTSAYTYNIRGLRQYRTTPILARGISRPIHLTSFAHKSMQMGR